MHTVPVAAARELVGQLAARGYPTEWIAREALLPKFATWLDEQQEVTADVYARLQWLCRTFGYRNATKEQDRIETRRIRNVQRQAVAAGFHPPLPPPTLGERKREATERSWLPGFDRNGDFSPRFLPGHQFERNDSLCGSLRDALGLTLTTTMTRDEVMAATGCYEEQLSRMRRRLGLAVEQDEFGDWVLVEKWPGAAKAARDIWEALDDADDVTLACLQQGIAVPMGTHVKYVPHISVNHPAVAAYRRWERDLRERAVEAALAAPDTRALVAA